MRLDTVFKSITNAFKYIEAQKGIMEVNNGLAYVLGLTAITKAISKISLTDLILN